MSENIKFIKKIINPYAYTKVAQFVIRAYQLNKAGEEFIVKSNRDLTEQYFEHLLFPVSSFWGAYFEEKINILEPIQKNTFIDVCCGTGTLCLNIYSSSGFEKCIAIDNSQVAINVLEGRINSLQAIEVRKEDITKTNFDDGAIDAVYGNSFLHHLPDNYSFFRETFRILTPGGVVVLTGEPTIGAAFLEGVIMKFIINTLVFLRIKKEKVYQNDMPVTDVWLYEEESLRIMLQEIGFVDIKIQGFGVLVPLFNSLTALILGKLTGRSMQPEVYWKWLGWLDKKLFSWLPVNKHSHCVIAARKPIL